MSLWAMLFALACSGETPETPTPETPPDNVPVTEPEPEVPAPSVTNPENIKQVLTEKSPEVRACYDAELTKNPELAGEVGLDVVIKGGKITNVGIAESTLNTPQLEACIRKAVLSWQFAQDVNGEVYFPFVFQPSEE